MLLDITQFQGGKAFKQKLDSIASGASKVEVSSRNGNILINGVEAPVYKAFHGHQTWTSAGTHAFIVPENVYRLSVDFLIGAGGGGGGAKDSTHLGGNGGMGQILCSETVEVVPGQELIITIGAGGNGGASATRGSAGGASAIGSLLMANGGGGGPYWNSLKGSPGIDGGPNDSPYINTAFKYGLYGLGRTGSKGSGTNGADGYCSLSW